jgi:hypothetical protein
MISPAKLKMLSTYDDAGLALTLEACGYKNILFKTAKFLGLTNGNQFCYSVTFDDPHTGGVERGKVFLTYHPAEDKITADY